MGPEIMFIIAIVIAYIALVCCISGLRDKDKIIKSLSTENAKHINELLTIYKKFNITAESEPIRTKTFSSQIIVPENKVIPSYEVQNDILNDLASQIAEYLVDDLQIHIYYDGMVGQTTYIGELAILEKE